MVIIFREDPRWTLTSQKVLILLFSSKCYNRPSVLLITLYDIFTNQKDQQIAEAERIVDKSKISSSKHTCNA